jgi:hypothetical protein
MEETRLESLERERREVIYEIRNYPAPIAGCDAQFNFLLEERNAIEQKIADTKAADQTK